MAKPKKLSAVDLPYILEGLIREADFHQRNLVTDEDPWWDDISNTLPESQMWYVTEPMAKLAYSYSNDIPEWDLAAVRPSLTGILIWEGSSGKSWSFTTPDNHTYRGAIIGAWWGVWNDEPTIMPLIRTEDAPPIEARGKLVGFGPHISPQKSDTTEFSKMLGATMILAQTETVATRKQRSPGYSLASRPHLPMSITQIVLRERVRTAHDFEATQPQEDKDRKWTLKNRHLVRGHWRNQAYGPNRELRKPTFVPPYIKGPDDGELKTTEQVHIWRR